MVSKIPIQGDASSFCMIIVKLRDRSSKILHPMFLQVCVKVYFLHVKIHHLKFTIVPRSFIGIKMVPFKMLIFVVYGVSFENGKCYWHWIWSVSSPKCNKMRNRALWLISVAILKEWDKSLILSLFSKKKSRFCEKIQNLPHFYIKTKNIGFVTHFSIVYTSQICL